MLRRRKDNIMAESKLWPRNKIIADETDIPTIPHFFWRSARRDYEGGESVSAILMAGLAVESGVNEYASHWMHRMFGKEPAIAMKFLEEPPMNFRMTVKLLWFVGEFKEDLKDDLNAVYNSRNRYAHIQTSKILGKIGEEEVAFKDSEGKIVQKVKMKDDDFFRAVGVIANADAEAQRIIELTEQCMSRLFEKSKSDYWKRLVWNIKGPATSHVPPGNGGKHVP
jgi:hypothetical protein